MKYLPQECIIFIFHSKQYLLPDRVQIGRTGLLEKLVRSNHPHTIVGEQHHPIEWLEISSKSQISNPNFEQIE